MTRYKREYVLERLNNDLAIYLKVLKSSMSELINKEYADFVNLSINLVGLDKAINDLKKPLIAIKNDVEVIFKNKFLTHFIHSFVQVDSSDNR